MTASKAHATTFALALSKQQATSLLLVSVLSALGCRQAVEIGALEPGPERDSGTTGSTDATAVDAMTPSADAAACVPTRCRGGVRACADCIDNDADGFSDATDPDCWSPCDDTEDSLSGSTQMCPDSDCFFDPDCGAGNDQACLGLTPNGCDCFGCCHMPNGAGAVFLGSRAADSTSSCTSSSLSDPLLCQPCTPDALCVNSCDACELCFGAPELEPECQQNDAGCSVPACSDGRTPCGGCAGSCTDNEVCVSGCCVTPR